ncbi:MULTISPECIES: ArsR/SmtB family transcription factor [Streptomyces]|uniref:ArsR/SmtB family transcription factor n=1 Tax=Streptomyces celluloflavus TaxID=58344 RepID=A0ABW7REV1_9ACTN|nr:MULTISPECIES: metalloregulator ArsR/SmtB family transcription factor [Streptomyces]MYU51645.1 helix-turn-helix domain-containing protein [Streptomyces sp. SID7805]WSK14442.1 helix-turn-helix domain-containing protein [Streptomyces celluloflavus]
MNDAEPLKRPENEIGDGELLEQPDAADIELVKVLHALGDPTRLHLFRVYADGERYSCSSERLGVGHLHKSTVSHHMRIMREAGITATRAVGRNRYVRLRRADLDARFPGLVETLLRAYEGNAPQVP